MRALPLLVLALLAAPLAFPADAAGPVAPTLGGPTNIPAARNWTFSGQLVVDSTGAPAPLYGQTIGMWLNGVRVSETETDAQGKYIAKVTFPVGTHTLTARAFEGSMMEGESAPLSVRSYPTWPAAPGSLHGDPGFYITQTNVSWYYPWTDGGHPVTSFRIDRSVDGGPFTTVFQGLGLQYVDPDVVPGETYTYHGYSTTAWGTSNKTVSVYTTNDTIATVGIVEFRICDDAVCLTVPDGGSFTANASVDVRVIGVNMSGLVDVYPVSPPGFADRAVFGRVIFPNMTKDFETTSGAGGTWTKSLGTFFARAPAATGCATIAVVAQARPQKQGHDEDVGSFALCVP